MIFKALVFFWSLLDRTYARLRKKVYVSQMGYCHNSVEIHFPVHISPKEKVHIEEGVAIAPFVQIWASGGVTIGKNSLIASHVAITSSTHDYSVTPIRSKRIDKPVNIGSDVWIGSGAIILPGISIGDGAVIGAGAVVTKNVAEREIVAGVPAKVIKHREESRSEFEEAL